MEPKPKGWGRKYADAFQVESAVERYPLRPPYPPQTIERLSGLAVDRPRTVLDAGCGTGELARRLAGLVARVDAVDASEAMLQRGRSLRGGRSPNLRWIHARVEEAELEPPYALIVAGDSVHWFDWEVALPRFAAMLSPRGALAIVFRDWSGGEELRERLRPIYARHGTNSDFRPLDPVVEIERRGLFERLGEWTSPPAPWRPSLDELNGCHHSQSSFVLEWMRDPAAFDAELEAALEDVPRDAQGRLELDVVARVTWGRPKPL